MGDLDPTILRRARDLYAVYCASSDGKNYQRRPLPDWDTLTPASRGHWYTVACRALQLGYSNSVVDTLGKESELEPSDYAIGHLPDKAHALNVWRRYSGIQ
jgi:hypothetical protein